MHRWLAILLALDLIASGSTAAQDWDDAETRSLVARAIARRQGAFADSTVRSYTARARGVVTFRLELGGPTGLSPMVAKADELLVEVYWRRPDRSKQVISAWRDTTLLPANLGYHRDHLGIVADDFGPTIRVGDGDEVADVPHPLSPSGSTRYQYRRGDTLAIVRQGGRLVVVALEVRPRELSQPGVVGTFFLDRDQAQLVRARFTFTPSAYRDRDLEDLTIRLERTLIDDRHWVPHRQEIEIRRRLAVLDFPIRGIIRGDWVITDAVLNAPQENVAWEGPTIAGLRRPGDSGAWPTSFAAVVDSLVGSQPWRNADAVRAEATRLARSRLLDGLPRFGLSVSQASDVLRYSRVQGLVVGGGFAWRGPGPLDRVGVGLEYGFGDRRVMGRIDATKTAHAVELRLSAHRRVADVGAFRSASGVVNSIAAQEWGRDHGDYVLEEAIGLEAAVRAGTLGRVAMRVAREWSYSVGETVAPARGRVRPNPPLGSAPQWTASIELSGGRVTAGRLRDRAFEIRAEMGIAARTRYGRLVLNGESAHPLAGGAVGLRGFAGLATADVPVRRSFAFGGVGSLLGEPFRAYGGRRVAWASGEWLFPLPGPRLGLGAFGRTGAEVRIGPVVAVGVAGGAVSQAPWRIPAATPTSAGLAAELFDRMVRVELGTSLGRARRVGLAIDFHRAWWPVL
jgi:hypothetical protein